MAPRKVFLALTVLVVATVGTARAHDMFLKLDSFFLAPHSAAVVSLINGTFDRSENAITRDRLADVTIVGPDGARHPPTSAWRDTAAYHSSQDSIDTSLLEFETGSAGTYVIGVSTRPTVFTLTAQDFNDYLAHDGVVDIIEARERKGQADDAATERYSKHVKALVQVGESRSDDFSHALGYPVEFVPLQNPYSLRVGDVLEVRFVRDGRAVPDHVVYASHESFHGHDDDGEHLEAVSTRTDAYGIAVIELTAPGKWYVRTIHMVETAGESDVDYESNWATLTFEIR